MKDTGHTRQGRDFKDVSLGLTVVSLPMSFLLSLKKKKVWANHVPQRSSVGQRTTFRSRFLLSMLLLLLSVCCRLPSL